jgi:hypothetical protein
MIYLFVKELNFLIYGVFYSHLKLQCTFENSKLNDFLSSGPSAGYTWKF